MRSTVAIVRCPDYQPERVASAVSDLMDALGGIDAFTGSGRTVLIKPNLLTDAEPDRATTTHPEVIRALVRMLGPSGAAISIGDSPAKAVQLDRVLERTGFRALCAETGISAVRFEQHPTQPLTCGQTVMHIAEAALNADLLVNVPKLKTHLLTRMTGAVKNLYGTLPGYQKTILHREFATPKEFGRLPAALYARLRPGLNIADAVMGMEGAGPAGGDPIHLGFLAAATDAVALDTALCAVIGIDPRELPWTAHLPTDAMDLLDFKTLDYPRLRPYDVRPSRFRVPSSLWPRCIPGGLTRRLGAWLWIRPEFGAACIRCRRCVKACCNDALRLAPEDARPVLTPARCVACCCCHEVCPVRAVQMRQSPLLNWVRRGKQP